MCFMYLLGIYFDVSSRESGSALLQNGLAEPGRLDLYTGRSVLMKYGVGILISHGIAFLQCCTLYLYSTHFCLKLPEVFISFKIL